jgi:hypothetical protein
MHSIISRLSLLWERLQLVVALAITIAFLIYLLLPESSTSEPESPSATQPVAVVEVVGPRLIRVQPDTPFARHLQIATVSSSVLTRPLLTVTGRVAASLRPDQGGGYWQFDSPQVLEVFRDWQKAQSDITFAQTQLQLTRQLATARLEAQKLVIARLEKLVAAGSDAMKDLATERSNLIQIEIQTRKEIHEAETALQVAHRNEAALSRQLQQLGLDPQLLQTLNTDGDIVIADVPEGWLERVRVGQSCQARFLGLSDEIFTGKVNSVAPVLSKERRSLRVLFVIHDPLDKLRPGMFAEIGLGTDPRRALFIPSESVLHIGRSDYVLVRNEDVTWRVVEVQVGEPHNGILEVLKGLHEGDQVIGQGAILLKPLVVRALQQSRPWMSEEP